MACSFIIYRVRAHTIKQISSCVLVNVVHVDNPLNRFQFYCTKFVDPLTSLVGSCK